MVRIMQSNHQSVNVIDLSNVNDAKERSMLFIDSAVDGIANRVGDKNVWLNEK